MTTNFPLTFLFKTAPIIAALLLAGCSAEPVSTAQDVSEAEGPDYTALLTRTDSVEVCMRVLSTDMAKSYRPETMAPDLVKLSCDCIQDNAEFQLNQGGWTDPVLVNAVIQSGTNLDVIPSVFQEFEAFHDYMTSEAEQALGFGWETYHSAVQSVDDGPDFESEEMGVDYITSNVPSCAENVRLTAEYFPEWDPSTGQEGFKDVLESYRLNAEPS
ncbi:MAG: hypothetical protein AAFX02_11395 [Pseudomonadota bacterium]